jgi:excisionase family DNA binding protein
VSTRLHPTPLPFAFTNRNPVAPLLLDTEQVAELLSVHKKTVEKMCRHQLIPGAFKIGKFWRLHRVVLEQWLLTQGSRA